ncbi:MAG: amylo-alpha-1,6-glucosidase [Candidatus Pacebacteria bacterium]|nr:amylo-alpha-1,6-glucosidase [Candidatus Paceibacterota bacterium]
MVRSKLIPLFRELAKILHKEKIDIRAKDQLLKEINSLRNKRGYIDAGLPRFGRLFGRDSLITAWQFLEIEPEIAKKTLKSLMRFQGKRIDDLREEEPGKIIHEWSPKRISWVPFPFPYYGSVDSTPLFLIVFSFYIKKTNDKKFLKRHWRKISAAVNWMKEYGDEDNDSFLEYKRKNPKGLFHQAWKDSVSNHLNIEPPVAIVEAQGYQYLALKETAKLAQIMKDKDLKKGLLKRARILKKRFNDRFWMPDKKYFALALDKDKKQKKAITSNPGHLLFTGIIDKNKIKPVVGRLFKDDIWTVFGIRTHSKREKDFNPLSYHLGTVWPHDNWIIAQGLKKLGFKKEYLRIKKALLRVYNSLGYLPEFYGVSYQGKLLIKRNKLIIKGFEKDPNYPQAWSSGAMLMFTEKDKKDILMPIKANFFLLRRLGGKLFKIVNFKNNNL